ncbi:MAG TPA: glutaredoxin family protein [Candidatus Paceibacterota bacterium]|jgi:glutaredoxin-like YruB-family protein|nr:glutaredoxin family protein [Candidatus Paceibacterota bacterium]HRV32532.1 glutaredoxin family protein [Candidatus Paceibacterota bacterium]
MIILYTAPGCPWCHVAKNFLDEHHIEYIEKDVSNPNYATELIQKTGQTSIPVLDIDGQIVRGFDKEKIQELLNIQS